MGASHKKYVQIECAPLIHIDVMINSARKIVYEYQQIAENCGCKSQLSMLKHKWIKVKHEIRRCLIETPNPEIESQLQSIQQSFRNTVLPDARICSKCLKFQNQVILLSMDKQR